MYGKQRTLKANWGHLILSQALKLILLQCLLNLLLGVFILWEETKITNKI